MSGRDDATQGGGRAEAAPPAEALSAYELPYGGWSVAVYDLSASRSAQALEATTAPDVAVPPEPEGGSTASAQRLRQRLRARREAEPQGDVPPPLPESSATSLFADDGANPFEQGEEAYEVHEPELVEPPAMEHDAADADDPPRDWARPDGDDDVGDEGAPAAVELVPSPGRRALPAGEDEGGLADKLPRPALRRSAPLSVPARTGEPLQARPRRTRRDAPGERGAAGRERAGRSPVAAAPSGDEGEPRLRRAHRIEGGGSVVIEDRLFQLVDWSSNGISVRSDEQLYRIGDRQNLELEFDLGDYAVNIDLEGEVTARNSSRTGWSFTNLSETQRQVMRALTHASASGRPFAPPRAGRVSETAEPEARRRRRSRGGGALLGALASLPFNAALVAVLAGLAIYGMDLAENPAANGASGAGSVRAQYAAVAVERVPLAAPAAGIVLEWAAAPGEAVGEGEAVVSLADDRASGQREVALSPCDCVVARLIATRGTRVAEGEALAALYPREAEGHVQALFRTGAAPNLGDAVDVELPYSGERLTGVVDRVGRLANPDAYIGLSPDLLAGSAVYARIETDPSVPAALAGTPVLVSVPVPDA